MNTRISWYYGEEPIPTCIKHAELYIREKYNSKYRMQQQMHADYWYTEFNLQCVFFESDDPYMFIEFWSEDDLIDFKSNFDTPEDFMMFKLSK